MSGLLESGERVILIDSRGRRYLVRLHTGEKFHYHGGILAHDDLIGRPEGTELRTPSDAALVAFRPRLADFVLKMGRGAQVIYPKDLGPILVEADIFPGARVLEAGTGSGAVTIALARAIGPEGRLLSCELREEFHAVARRNVEDFFGKSPPWVEFRLGDVREVKDERFDRIVLDLPEPWGVLAVAERTLDPGGVLLAYLPTTGQVQTFALALERGPYAEVRTFETMVRGWHVSPRSVRPDHRMVAHTGFLTTARRMAP